MQLRQVEPSGIEPESCNRPFVGFGAVEHQSRPHKLPLPMALLRSLHPKKYHLCSCQRSESFRFAS
ncbi:hypothetical protein JYQ62_26300 [Nostoc sp. UHCC 0702]|nr:hypothetical protein JYQ62_26300 [Nostoc sp. UHCC 0702]